MFVEETKDPAIRSVASISTQATKSFTYLINFQQTRIPHKVLTNESQKKSMKAFIASAALMLLVYPLNRMVTATTVTDRAGAAEAPTCEESWNNGGAPWFGATPPKKSYEMHRRGWEECLRCGGAERLGATLNIANVSEITQLEVEEVLDAVRAHGIVVIKGQNLTRSQQVDFTNLLGDVIVLPSSFEGKDPEPYHPAIQRITNFWANNTWVSFSVVRSSIVKIHEC